MPASDSVDPVALLNRHGQRLLAYFDAVLARFPEAPPRLMESIRYSLLAGGKRLRPALVLESAQACAAPDGDPAAIESSALAAAAAMELIHTFSLVHDDLPAMDNDDLRRGRPTNHKVFGEALAILAGDAMVTLAFEILASEAEPRSAPALIRELAQCSGPEGMIGGQVLDIECENQRLALPDLQRLHRMKTGALLTASCRMGAMAAGASDPALQSITKFGQHLGLAFQIVDDILDVTSTPEQLGKATNKDSAHGKNTYPSLIGVDQSRQQAAQQLALALDSLRPLGPCSAGLRALAEFVVTRSS